MKKFDQFINEANDDFSNLRSMAKAILAIDNDPDEMTEPIWKDAVKIAKSILKK